MSPYQSVLISINTLHFKKRANCSGSNSITQLFACDVSSNQTRFARVLTSVNTLTSVECWLQLIHSIRSSHNFNNKTRSGRDLISIRTLRAVIMRLIATKSG